MSFQDPDDRQAWAERSRLQQEANKRCASLHATNATADYRTFRLTAADALLLDEVCRVRPWVYLRTCGEGSDYRAIRAVWAVLGERHGFDASTATEHPEGGAQIIAKAQAKSGPTMRSKP